MGEPVEAVVYWGEAGERRVASVDELDVLLDRLDEEARRKPFIVQVEVATGDVLSLGVGTDRTVMNWVGASNYPPYYASKGDPTDEDTIVFYFGGDYSEFPGWSVISCSTARAAVREFFLTGERPSGIAWEEV